jgi:cation/acetate symporter
VAQYIILILAYLIPVVWLSMKVTNFPIPQLSYGYALQKVTEREKVINSDPKELEVRGIYKERAAAADAKLEALKKDGATYLAQEKTALEKKLAELKAAKTPDDKAIAAAQKALDGYPKDAGAAGVKWRADKAANEGKAAPVKAHAEAFPGKDEKASSTARNNFLALIFCLMVGTAALPHILMRYYTTPSVKEARSSVGWSLFFIFLLYFTAPALAVLVKFDVYTHLVGSAFADLPSWVARWAAVDASLISIVDLNKDGIVQLAEISMHGDMIVLATPEIAGLPYVISGLVAAGGLAAALSTADGLLLTIANALSHDVYYKMINPHADTKTRLTVAKVLLLGVALIAAYVASQKPADILFLVSAAFSFAAAGFFPALVLGIFWKRASNLGAILGMIAGVGVTFYYMATTQPWLRGLFNVTSPIADNKWFDIEPISAGVFGVPIGFAVIIIVSLLTKEPDAKTQALIEHVRYPHIKGDIDTRAT